MNALLSAIAVRCGRNLLYCCPVAPSLHGGGLQGAVDLFRGLHQPEAAGRFRHADGDGNGDVVDVLAVAAYSGLARGAGHFDAPLAAFRSAWVVSTMLIFAAAASFMPPTFVIANAPLDFSK